MSHGTGAIQRMTVRRCEAKEGDTMPLLTELIEAEREGWQALTTTEGALQLNGTGSWGPSGVNIGPQVGSLATARP